MNFLEQLTVSAKRAKVLNFLYLRGAKEEAMAERDIARGAGIAIGGINKLLRTLVDDQLLIREYDHQGPIYRAPHEDPRLVHLFAFIRENSPIVDQIKMAFKNVPHIACACIFGSFATGTSHKESDIDVLILSKPGFDQFATLILAGKLERKIGREIHLQLYQEEEFLSLIEQGDPIAKGIAASSSILIKGKKTWMSPTR